MSESGTANFLPISSDVPEAIVENYVVSEPIPPEVLIVPEVIE